MKSFDELSNPEILALNEVEIETYIDLACAEAGVPFVPPVPTEPIQPKAEPDLSLFKISVSGTYGCLLVKDGEVASQILDALARTAVYELEYTGHVVDVNAVKQIAPGSYNYPKIETIQALSSANYTSCKQALEVHTAAKKKYDDEKKEYDRAVSLRADIASEIREKQYTAIADRDLRNRLRGDFQRYLELADGNAEIAERFFKKAYPNYDIDGEYLEIKAA